MVEVPPKTSPRLFLIDGYALIYRAFFAMISRPLTTSRGENTSAEFGFVRFLLKILEERKFPVRELRAFASARSAGKTVTFKG